MNQDLLFSAALDLAKPTQDLDKFAGHVAQTGQAMETSAGKGDGLLGALGSIGSLATGIGTVATGVGFLGGKLFEAAQAAGDDKASMDRLVGSLQNSAGDWKGQTDALDDYISKGQALAFSDDSIRDSLNLLVTQTHSLKDAQTLQATAMDLARGKNISLEQATRLVMKADDESYAALGKLGIQIDKNSTKEEALAAIHNATAGAAQTFASSTAGSMQRLQGSMDDAVEAIGGAILPQLTAGLGAVADFVSSDAFQGALTTVVGLLSDGIGGAISFVSSIIGPFVPLVTSLADSFFGWMSGSAPLPGILGGLTAPISGIQGALSSISGVIQSVVTGFGSGGLAGAASALTENLPGVLTSLQGIGMGIASSAVDWGLQLVRWVGDAVPGLVTNLASFGGALFTWITSTGIPQAAGFLMGLGQQFIDFILPALPGIVAQLQTWGTGMIDWVLNTGIPQAVSTLVSLGQAFVDWIGPQIGPMVTELGTLGASIIEWSTTVALPMIVGKLAEWGGAFLDWIGPNIQPMLAKAGELLGSLGGWIVNTALPDLISNLSRWGGELIAWIGPQIPPLLQKLGEFAGAVWNWLTTDAIPTAVSKLGELGSAFLNWVGTDAIPFIAQKLSEFGQAIWSWVTDTAVPAAVSKLKEVGSSMITGILNGLSAGKDAVINFITSLAGQVIDSIKNALGIKSPSKVMAALFGTDGFMGGAIVGVAAGKDPLLRAVDQSLGAAAARAAGHAQGLAATLGGLGVGPGGSAASVARAPSVAPAPASGGGGLGDVHIYLDGELIDPSRLSATVRTRGRGRRMRTA